MKKPNISPGEWTAHKENALVSYVFADDKTVAKSNETTDGSGRKEKYPDGVITSAEEAHANAIFISAAPDMADALIDFLESGDAHSRMKARAALRKAGYKV